MNMSAPGWSSDLLRRPDGSLLWRRRESSSVLDSS